MGTGRDHLRGGPHGMRSCCARAMSSVKTHTDAPRRPHSTSGLAKRTCGAGLPSLHSNVATGRFSRELSFGAFEGGFAEFLATPMMRRAADGEEAERRRRGGGDQSSGYKHMSSARGSWAVMDA